MNSLIIYDSQFGNTEKIARVIAKSISAKVMRVSDVKEIDLENIKMLIVGSPTQGGRATAALQQLLEQIPSKKLNGVKVAAFDTRFGEENVNFALRMLMKTIDYAAPKMAKILINKGGEQIVTPEGFIVKDKAGPLASGELERAKSWIKQDIL